MEKNLVELLENGMVTKAELEYIEEHEEVETCEYKGLEHGHAGNYLYHVTLNNKEEYSITVDKKEYDEE